MCCQRGKRNEKKSVGTRGKQSTLESPPPSVEMISCLTRFICPPHPPPRQTACPHPAPPSGAPLGMPMNVSPRLGGHMPHGGHSMPFPGGFRPGQPGQNHNPLQLPRGGGPRGTAPQGSHGYGASPAMGPTLPSQPVSMSEGGGWLCATRFCCIAVGGIDRGWTEGDQLSAGNILTPLCEWGVDGVSCVVLLHSGRGPTTPNISSEHGLCE